MLLALPEEKTADIFPFAGHALKPSHFASSQAGGTDSGRVLLYDAEIRGFAEHVRDVPDIHLGIDALAVRIDRMDGQIDALGYFRRLQSLRAETDNLKLIASAALLHIISGLLFLERLILFLLEIFLHAIDVVIMDFLCFPYIPDQGIKTYKTVITPTLLFLSPRTLLPLEASEVCNHRETADGIIVLPPAMNGTAAVSYMVIFVYLCGLQKDNYKKTDI